MRTLLRHVVTATVDNGAVGDLHGVSRAPWPGSTLDAGGTTRTPSSADGLSSISTPVLRPTDSSQMFLGSVVGTETEVLDEPGDVISNVIQEELGEAAQEPMVPQAPIISAMQEDGLWDFNEDFILPPPAIGLQESCMDDVDIISVISVISCTPSSLLPWAPSHRRDALRRRGAVRVGRRRVACRPRPASILGAAAVRRVAPCGGGR